MGKTKARRNEEKYEEYWNFTAAHTNIYGVKFQNCLQVIIDFIDKNKQILMQFDPSTSKFADLDLYDNLQEKIVKISLFTGSDPKLSARKVINQFVKIGFINPFLKGYHPIVKEFLKGKTKEDKKVVFSKIFYEASSLASSISEDNKDLNHIAFFLKTLEQNKTLGKNDIIALMVTNINQYSRGYLSKKDLILQYNYAKAIEFDDRKYNQISHLTSYLKNVTDLVFDNTDESFYFADDPTIIDRDLEPSTKRDPIKHRIYKDELKLESNNVYGKIVCFLDKKEHNKYVASHIKPLKQCLLEGKEYEAYDKENGLLLSANTDSYFDKFDISFGDDGKILFGKKVSDEIKTDMKNFRLDEKILTDTRKEYLKYHRQKYFEKNGEK